MMTREIHGITCLAAFTIALVSTMAFAQDSQPAPAAALTVYPHIVQLDQRNDRQRIVVVRAGSDGVEHDVTAEATFAIDPPDVAVIAAPGVLRPTKAGTCVLTVTHDRLRARIEIKVADAQHDRPISFRNDVEPVLMKAGCNSGTCHGNARGQDGFKLSLFGFDPAADFQRMTRESTARRVEPAAPDESLMVRKSLGEATHGGGQRFAKSSREYDVLNAWLRADVPDDPANLERLTGIELLPGACVLSAAGAQQQLIVRAMYSNGSDRDVTDLAVFSSLDDTVAKVSPLGLVTTAGHGEAFIMARFGTFAVVTQVIVVPDTPLAWPEFARPHNYIDQAVDAKLRKLRITPSGICDDRVFARRAYLDVLGVLPTVNELRNFVADERADKRARLIDELLKRPEFPELWAMKWAELLRIESGKLNVKGVQLYSAWLRDAIQSDVPIDRLVRELLGAQGGNYHNPASNFYLVETNPKQMAENVAQVFMGVRVQCAQCHNHPFDRWTQDDYYSFAAFFAQIGRKQAEDPRETIIYNSGGGEVRHLRSGAVMPPKFLGGAVPQIKPGQDRRKLFADWLTSPENPWFARNVVNRVWAQFFGRGIVDPPDDVRVSNPPSHPKLLAELARRFIASGYDMRALVRDMCNSRAYQTASTANESNAGDQRNFSHAAIRRLSAEALLDAISQVTQVREKFAGLPLGARAVQVADAKTGSYFLTTFGRPARTSACTCERREAPTLSQALHLVNGATISSKIRDKTGRLNRLLSAGKAPDQIIEEFFVAALARPPTASERAEAIKYVNESADARQGLEDLLWALLNSQEFVFNH